MSVEEFDGDFTMTRFGPWKRGRPETKIYGCYKIDVNFPSLRFDTDIYPNMDIDKEVKIAARKTSPSIVSIYIQECVDTLNIVRCLGDGDEDMYGCGTIIDSEYVDGKHIATILTSASLLSSGGKNQVKAEIHIHVQLADGTKFEANLFSYDWHYNIATLRIDSTTPFSKCTIRFLDDSISIDPELNMKRGVESSQESDFFNLIPGDTVIAVGRYWEDSSLMVASGAFCIDLCENLDCTELFKAECRITKNGLGGPLLNRNGDVIGVNFYFEKYTPFLAINVVCKCLEYSKRCGKFPHPELGIIIANLYATRMDKLDIVFRKFPQVFKGVTVEKVVAESNAARAGLLPDDVIIECDGNPVRGVLEFLELVLAKCGESVELTVVRSKDGVQLNLSMVIDEMLDLNRWPLRSQFHMPINRCRGLLRKKGKVQIE